MKEKETYHPNLTDLYLIDLWGGYGEHIKCSDSKCLPDFIPMASSSDPQGHLKSLLVVHDE